MLMWSSNLPEITNRFDFLDLFAGVANATKVWSAAGYRCATFDHLYFPNQRVMDFLSEPGFLLPASTSGFCGVSLHGWAKVGAVDSPLRGS